MMIPETVNSIGTVLFIDDKPKNLVLLIGRLDDMGYDVLVAKSGRKGLALAEDEQPDIVLLDVRMPEMDGFETCRQLKTNQLTRDIPVIFLTALEETVNKVAGFKLGAVDYLTKSSHPEEVAARVGVHINLRQAQLELQAANDEVRKVAVLEERQRLARDLHDAITQSLYGVMLFARASRDAQEVGDDLKLKENLEEIEVNSLQTLKEMRLLLHQLRPLSLEHGGIAAAIVRRFDQVERRLGITATAEIGKDLDLSPTTEESLYFITAEALNNSLKHSNAREVRVNFDQSNGDIQLIIEDNGQGFDQSRPTAGMGLRNMRERADLEGGDIEIWTEEGKGTRVTVTIPHAAEGA